MTNKIVVRFAPDSSFQLPVKQVVKTAPAAGSRPEIFAELRQHPDKIEAALQAAKRGNGTFPASWTVGRSAATRIRQNAPSAGAGARQRSSRDGAEPPALPAPPMTLKRRMLLLAGRTLASLAWVGREPHSSATAPASAQSAGDQPLPDVAASN